MFKSLALGAGAILMATCVQAQTAPSVPIRLGHGAAADHPMGVAAEKFAGIVGQLSGDKIKVKVYPATQLGSETQMVSAVRGGVQDMLITSTAPVATLSKEFLLFDLPFLLQSDKEADALLDGPIGQRLLDSLQDKNMRGLCYWENGFRQITNSKRSIQKADDVAGLKLRVMQNPVYIDSFNALGANAVPMPFTELYAAMESRAIDAQENPVALIQASKFYEVQKYVTLSKHAYAPYVVLVSKALWDKLGPAEQDLMKKGCQQARDFQRSLNRRMTAQQIDQLKSHGMTVNELAPAEAEKMRAKLKPVMERYTREIGPALVQQAQLAIATVRDGNK